jgi:hypothetical protein
VDEEYYKTAQLFSKFGNHVIDPLEPHVSTVY